MLHITQPIKIWGAEMTLCCRRALAYQQCGLGTNPGIDANCGSVKFVLALLVAPGEFSLLALGFSPLFYKPCSPFLSLI